MNTRPMSSRGSRIRPMQMGIAMCGIGGADERALE